MTLRNRHDDKTTLPEEARIPDENGQEHDGEQVLSEPGQITSDLTNISLSPPSSTTVPTSTTPSTFGPPSAATTPTPIPQTTETTAPPTTPVSPPLPPPLAQNRLRRFLSRLPRSPLSPLMNKMVIAFILFRVILYVYVYHWKYRGWVELGPFGPPDPFRSDRFKTVEDLEFLGQRLGLIRESTNKTENIFCEPTEIMDDDTLKELFPEFELDSPSSSRALTIQFRDPELRGHVRVLQSSRVKVPTLRVVEARMSSRLQETQHLGSEIIKKNSNVKKTSSRVLETLPNTFIAPLGLREVKINHRFSQPIDLWSSPEAYVTVGFKDSLRQSIARDRHKHEWVWGVLQSEHYFHVARYTGKENKDHKNNKDSQNENKETLSSLEIREECGFLKMELVMPAETGTISEVYISGPILEIEIGGNEQQDDHRIQSNSQQTESESRKSQSTMATTGVHASKFHLLSLFGDIKVHSATSFNEINAATAVGNVVLNNLSLDAPFYPSFTISAKTQQGNVIVDIPKAPPVRPLSSLRPIRKDERPQSSRSGFELKATSELGQVLATVPSMLWGNTSVTALFSTVHVVQPPLKKKSKHQRQDNNRDNHHDIDHHYNLKKRLSMVESVKNWFGCTFSIFTYSFRPHLKCVRFASHTTKTAIIRNQKKRFVQMHKPLMPDSVTGDSPHHSISIQSRRKSKDGRPSAVLVSLDDREADDNN